MLELLTGLNRLSCRVARAGRTIEWLEQVELSSGSSKLNCQVVQCLEWPELYNRAARQGGIEEEAEQSCRTVEWGD